MQRATMCLTTVALVVALVGCEQPKSASTSEPHSAPTQKAATPAQEPPMCTDCIPVTADNFPRAETDLYFATAVKQAGGIGKFFHYREVMDIDNQTVVRANRDTLYSAAIFDLDADPVTITLPDAGKRFMSTPVINEDQYTPMVVYGEGAYTLTKEKIGTRYVLAALRTLVNPEDPQDVQQVHALQDAIKVGQKSPGSFEVPKWDPSARRRCARRSSLWPPPSPT